MTEDQQSAIFQKLRPLLTVKADERIIFQFDQDLTLEDAANIKNIIRGALGDDLRFLVIGKDVDVSVINQEETATNA